MEKYFLKNLMVVFFFITFSYCRDGDLVIKSEVPGQQGEKGEQGVPGERGEKGETGSQGPAGKDAPYTVAGDIGFYEEQREYDGDKPIHLTCMLGESNNLGVVVLRIRSSVGGVIEVRKTGGIIDTLYIPEKIELFLYSGEGNGTYQVSLDGGSWNTKACSPL